MFDHDDTTGSSHETVNPAVLSEPVRKSAAALKFDEEIRRIYGTATADDHKRARALTTSTGEQDISPTVAAIVFTDFNKHNRSLVYSKCFGYANDMMRGEWTVHHQGIAFYAHDQTLADGQHRIAAVALSGRTERFMVYPHFRKEAIDKIDRASRRTAGEALEMMGVEDGKIKAGMAKVALEYIHELEAGEKLRLTDPQIEAFVINNSAVVTDGHVIGRSSIANVSDPCLSQADAATIALLMLMGGYPPQQVVGYIASIQQGVATYPESPTVDLARQFLRAKVSDMRRDRLGKREKIAYALKGAALWAENKSVARIKWNPAKEKLPSHRPPVTVQA